MISRELLLQFCLEHFDTNPRLPDSGIVHTEPMSDTLGDKRVAELRDLDGSLRTLSNEWNAARVGESVERDLLARLSSAICPRSSVRTPSEWRRLHRCSEMIRDAMNLVESEPDEMLDMRSMSKATGLSPRTLQRTFQAECGLPVDR